MLCVDATYNIYKVVQHMSPLQMFLFCWTLTNSGGFGLEFGLRLSPVTENWHQLGIAVGESWCIFMEGGWEGFTINFTTGKNVFFTLHVVF